MRRRRPLHRTPKESSSPHRTTSIIQIHVLHDLSGRSKSTILPPAADSVYPSDCKQDCAPRNSFGASVLTGRATKDRACLRQRTVNKGFHFHGRARLIPRFIRVHHHRKRNDRNLSYLAGQSELGITGRAVQSPFCVTSARHLV